MFQTSPILERFVVIEGLDGAGTSTQRRMLCETMERQSYPVWETWEPTDGPVGRLIRQVLRHEVPLGSSALSRLFAADREEHCFGRQGIVERTREGTWVVSDRSMFSSFAYQGINHDLEWIAELNRGFPLPEILIFVDVDLETSAARRMARGEAPELFEEDPIQARVRVNYRHILEVLARERPDVRQYELDGTLPPRELHAEIWRILGFPPIL